MNYTGTCHCGKVAFDVEGVLEQVIECNCTHCSRKGYLLWFVDRDKVTLKVPRESLATYTFNKHVIQHHFCPTCGCAPLGFGTDGKGVAKAAINARCLENVDLTTLRMVPVNGRDL
jgi:hypothetical protein